MDKETIIRNTVNYVKKTLMEKVQVMIGGTFIEYGKILC